MGQKYKNSDGKKAYFMTFWSKIKRNLIDV